MSEIESSQDQEKDSKKELKTMARRLMRAEEQLVDYERLVDRTQHLLNKRIEEVETAHASISKFAKELENSESRFRQLADAAFEAILIHSESLIVDCNEAAPILYGISRDELIGSSIYSRVHKSFHSNATDWIGETKRKAIDSAHERGDDTTFWLHEPTREPVEVTHVRGDETTFPVEVRSREINHKGETALVTAVRDITAHKELQAKLEHMANSDPLTGVGNRRFFVDAGKREYFRAIRYRQPLALLILDVDYFKKINDTYGHDIGDVALCEMANICSLTLRSHDIFARIGGEEFAAILPASDTQGAAIFAERLRKVIETNVINTDKGPISFTVSVGVTVLLDEDEGIEGMLHRADMGLYQAKEGGRNRVVVIRKSGNKYTVPRI